MKLLKCDCGKCKTCRNREYARKRARRLRLAGPSIPRRRVVNPFQPDEEIELPATAGRNHHTDSHSAIRREIFFTKRREQWALDAARRAL